MKKIFLYEGRNKTLRQTEVYVLVDDQDYDRLNIHKWYLMSIYHTNNKIFYARRYEGSTSVGTFRAILMHREILGLTAKKDKGDHKDGNGLNNQRSNLRIATHAQNMSNRKKRKGEYFGIQKRVNKYGKVSYVYQIKYNGLIKSKSGFVSEDVAAFERNKMAIQLKGEFATLNIIRWF